MVEHKSTDCVQIFDWIFNCIKYSSAICGLDFLDPNFKIWWATRVYFSGTMVASFGILYTIVTYDTQTALNTCTSTGIAFQGILKLCVTTINQQRLFALIQVLRHIHLQNGDPLSKQFEILYRWNTRFMTLAKMLVTIFMVTGSVFVLYPIPIYFVTGTRLVIFPLYFPILDETSIRGYYILTTIHVVFVWMVIMGLIACDLLLTMLIVYTLPMVEILKFSFQQLNELLVLGERAERSERVYNCLRNIVNIHDEISRYLLELSDIFFPICTTDVYTNGMTMSFIVYCIIMQFWMPLYVLFAMLLFKLFVVCLLGTVLETATDRILDTILMSNWYLLPNDLKMCVGLMTLRAQNPTVLLAGTKTLNLNTFVEVMKNVYSVSMIMVETVA